MKAKTNEKPPQKARQAARPARGEAKAAGKSQTATADETAEQRRARAAEFAAYFAEIAKQGPTTKDLEFATFAAELPEARRVLAEKTKALEAALTAALGAARAVDELHSYQGIVPSQTILGLLTWAAALLRQERPTWTALPRRGRSAKNLKLEYLHKQGFTHAQIAGVGLAADADQVRDRLRECVKKQRQRARKKKTRNRVRKKVRRPLDK